eukprot:TRINITY_DN116_c0_g2_i2.p1 TRINITY_DN116_c0_g2~~TRINITY_DN116_c0_g2_i2.p1  ORF type:complete len:169 (+),score=27.95 TRINITY_DN116_c0_g2_i2:152-658(+)
MADSSSPSIGQVIVVGVDGSDSCEFALKTAINVSKSESTVFHIVHVRSSSDDSLFEYRDHWTFMENRLEEQSKLLLEKYMEIARKAKVKAIAMPLKGDPREELCNYCKEVTANMLVIGTRNLGTLKRMLLGSVSLYCSHHAPCSVLITRPTAMDGKEKDALARTRSAA